MLFSSLTSRVQRLTISFSARHLLAKGFFNESTGQQLGGFVGILHGHELHCRDTKTKKDSAIELSIGTLQA